MVPELTRNADIQLNKLVSLNRIVLLGIVEGGSVTAAFPEPST